MATDSKQSHSLRVIIKTAETFNQIQRYNRLWIISFAYCNPLPSNLRALSSFACLGFVDLSYTQIDWRVLQETFRKTQIIRFHCFGCPHIEAVLSKQSHINRGFISFVLPYLWILNGVYLSCVERQYWRNYFTMDIKGVYSSLVRKWKLEDHNAFVPTRLTQRMSTFGDSASVYQRDADPNDPSVIWTDSARNWLEGCPTIFNMAVDNDIWRLRKLGVSFQGYIVSSMDSKKSRDIGGSISCLICAEIDDQSLEPPHEFRSLLCALMFGTLFQSIPIAVLDELVLLFFNPDDSKSKWNWASPTVSPLHWHIKDRMAFLGMLLGRIEVDNASPSKCAHSSSIIAEKQVKAMSRIISLIMHSVYPAHRSSNDATHIDFDFDSQFVPNSITTEREFVSSLSSSDHTELCELLLNILELTCLCPDDLLFLNSFPNLYGIYKACLSHILTSEKIEAMDLLWDQEDVDDVFNTENELCKQSIRARGCEVKGNFVLCIQRCINALESDDTAVNGNEV